MRKLLLLVLTISMLPAVLNAQQKKTTTKTTVKTTKQAPQYGPPKPPPGQSQEFRKPGSPIPPLAIEKKNGSLITNAQLKKGKSTWLMIFSPQCDHCEHMIDSFKNMAAELENVQIVLVAEPRNKEFMDAFIKKTDIGADPMFQLIGTDKGNLIFNIYNYQILPQLNIYNNRQKLEATYFGNFMMDSVRSYLRRAGS